jgi:hypothetical protein
VLGVLGDGARVVEPNPARRPLRPEYVVELVQASDADPEAPGDFAGQDELLDGWTVAPFVVVLLRHRADRCRSLVDDGKRNRAESIAKIGC